MNIVRYYKEDNVIKSIEEFVYSALDQESNVSIQEGNIIIYFPEIGEYAIIPLPKQGSEENPVFGEIQELHIFIGLSIARIFLSKGSETNG